MVKGGADMGRVIEALGFLLAVGFLWFVWPPLVILGTGLALIGLANARPFQPPDKRGAP